MCTTAQNGPGQNGPGVAAFWVSNGKILARGPYEQFNGTIPAEDLAAMQAAIEAGTEQVDVNKW